MSSKSASPIAGAQGFAIAAAEVSSARRPMAVLPMQELQRLLAEDVPFGDLTTETLGIWARSGRISFTARDAMVVAASWTACGTSAPRRGWMATSAS